MEETRPLPGPLRLLIGLVTLPHELAHYLVFAPWGRSLGIEFGGRRTGGMDLPLARLTGEFSPSIPTVVVRLGAVAPTLVFSLLAVVLDVTVGFQGPSAASLLLVFALAFWAAPSHGDLNVFIRARAVRESGSFDARGPVARAARPAATVLTVLVTWLVAGVLLL
jgi:hypothetical protein